MWEKVAISGSHLGSGHDSSGICLLLPSERSPSSRRSSVSPCPVHAAATGLRDFTINSLLYDPVADEVLDYVGAVPDIQNRVS